MYNCISFYKYTTYFTKAKYFSHNNKYLQVLSRKHLPKTTLNTVLRINSSKKKKGSLQCTLHTSLLLQIRGEGELFVLNLNFHLFLRQNCTKDFLQKSNKALRSATIRFLTNITPLPIQPCQTKQQRYFLSFLFQGKNITPQ